MLQKIKDGFSYGIGIALALTLVSGLTALLFNLALMVLGLILYGRPQNV